MKKWSIKQKIIILYTFLFTILIGLAFYFLKTASSQIINDQTNRVIINSTEEVAVTLQIEDDGIYVEDNDDDESFHFYHDGVLFLVYYSNQVAYGPIPQNFDASNPIEINTIQSQEYNGVSWLIYDVALEDGYVLRGIYDIDIMSSSVQRIILIAGIFSPILIVFAAVGGYIIIKRSFRPIREIYQTASSIKDEEDYSKRVPINTAKDEVYELSLMVNQMLDRVEQSINREKQFSSNVSHELRTPLTVMKAQAEYMLVHTDNKTQQEEINTIMSQVSFMESIVTQLLEITRTKQLSSGDMESIDLFELIKLTGDSLAPILTEKNISLQVNRPEFKAIIHCNQTMMIRVFSNLIMNSIKYNKQHGSIQIDFKKENKNIITTLSDTGIGISKENLEKIFNPFYRENESRSQGDYSLGLGLALVKEVIHIHHGDISVQSLQNVGTTFTITLPLSS